VGFARLINLAEIAKFSNRSFFYVILAILDRPDFLLETV
jgi:hypothetical protein